MDSIAEKFPYLIKKKLKEGQEVRRVAQLDWKIIEGSYEKPFVASGLQFVPLPVTFYKLLNLTYENTSYYSYIGEFSNANFLN